MKRKKQLLSWILSFLMVFSIMPMVSISAFATEYDNNDIGVSNTLKPRDRIENSNPKDPITIYYEGLDAIGVQSNQQHTVCDFPLSDEYMYFNWEVTQINMSGGMVVQIELTLNRKEKEKLTYDLTNTNIGEEDVEVTDGNKQVIDGKTYVTTGASVSIPITANTGYKLPDTIAVEMGGSTLGDSEYKYDQATGKIEIGNIIGDVKITAAGVKLPDATIDVSNVNKTSAALSSTIIQGSEAILDQGFEWKKTEGGTYVQIPGALSNGILTGNLTGLSENTSYTVRSFIVTESETYYGNEKVFITNYSIAVTTNVSNVTKTSADLSGTVTQGTEEIISQGFEWKKTDGGSYVQIPGALSNEILTANLTGLSENTSYTVRTFIETESGTYYGAESTFTTKKSTSSGSSSSGSSSSHSGSSSSNSSKSDILIVEPTEEVIIKALKTSGYKKIELNLDKNPNLLLSKAIIDALTENKDKILTIVNNNVSTNIAINENNEIQFTRNGNVLTGFISVSNSEYYTNYNGIVQKGWVQLPGETWYYFDKETGIKSNGWINDNGTWYYSNSAGVMQRGWLNDSGVWYYLDWSGKMLTGWFKDNDGKWYYLYENGSMARNTTVNGYYLAKDGEMI